MKRALIYLLLIGFLSVVSSCDSLELIDEFIPSEINIPEGEVVTIPAEGGSFEVYSLTFDKYGKRLDLSFNYIRGWRSYGDYDYHENEIYKVTYNRVTKIAKVEVFPNETGEDRRINMWFCPGGPEYSGYPTEVLQYGK